MRRRRNQTRQPLLVLHFYEADEPTTSIDIEDKVQVRARIKVLKGKGTLDVPEVTGYIDKAEYRTRFIYARGGDSCALMGQDILENSDPYGTANPPR